jgi:hypothetical protein
MVKSIVKLLCVFVLTARAFFFHFWFDDVVARNFPIRRGIFEDYVSTFWCLLDHSFYKVNT